MLQTPAFLKKKLFAELQHMSSILELAANNNQRFFPHEFIYKMLRDCRLNNFMKLIPPTVG